MWLLVLPLGFCWNSPHLTPPPPPPPPPLAPPNLHQENLLVHTAIPTSGPPCPPLTLAPSAVGAGLPQAWVSGLLAPRAPQPHPHPCCWLLALPWLLAGTPLSCVSTRAGGREARSGKEGAAAHPSRSSLLFQGLRGRAMNPTPVPGSSSLQKRAGRCQEPLPQTASLPLPPPADLAVAAHPRPRWEQCHPLRCPTRRLLLRLPELACPLLAPPPVTLSPAASSCLGGTEHSVSVTCHSHSDRMPFSSQILCIS